MRKVHVAFSQREVGSAEHRGYYSNHGAAWTSGGKWGNKSLQSVLMRWDLLIQEHRYDDLRVNIFLCFFSVSLQRSICKKCTLHFLFSTDKRALFGAFPPFLLFASRGWSHIFSSSTQLSLLSAAPSLHQYRIICWRSVCDFVSLSSHLLCVFFSLLSSFIRTKLCKNLIPNWIDSWESNEWNQKNICSQFTTSIRDFSHSLSVLFGHAMHSGLGQNQTQQTCYYI